MKTLHSNTDQNSINLYYKPRNPCLPVTIFVITLLCICAGGAIASHFNGLGMPGIIAFSITGGVVGVAFLYFCINRCKKHSVQKENILESKESSEWQKQILNKLLSLDENRLRLSPTEAASQLIPENFNLDNEHFKELCALTLLHIKGRYLYTAAILEIIAGEDKTKLEIIKNSLLKDLKIRFGQNINSTFTTKNRSMITCELDQLFWFGQVESQEILPKTLAVAFIGYIKELIKNEHKLKLRSSKTWEFLSPLLECLHELSVMELDLEQMKPFEEKHIEALLDIVKNNSSLVILKVTFQEGTSSLEIKKFIAAKDEIINQRQERTHEQVINSIRQRITLLGSYG